MLFSLSLTEREQELGCMVTTMNKRKLIMESNKHMYSYIEIEASKLS